MLAQAQPKPNGIVFRRWSLLLKELKTLLFKAHEPLISPLRVDAIVAVASPSAPPTAGHGSAPLDGSQSGSPNLSGAISRRKTIQTFKVAFLADSDTRKGFNDYLVLNNPSKSHKFVPSAGGHRRACSDNVCFSTFHQDLLESVRRRLCSHSQALIPCNFTVIVNSTPPRGATPPRP